MKLEVVTPDDYLGDVTADLISRRAEIDKTFDRGKLKVIEARAPLEKMFGYSTAVRSLSQGRASYSHGTPGIRRRPREHAGNPHRVVRSSRTFAGPPSPPPTDRESSMKPPFLALVAIALVAPRSATAEAPPVAVASPDGRVKATVALEARDGSASVPTLRVDFRGGPC